MQQTEQHKALVHKIRKARNGQCVSHVVYAFLRGEEPGTNAVPIVATVAIHEDGTWSPIAAREIPGGPAVPVEQLRGDRVWWGPWARRNAAALLEVHKEAHKAKSLRIDTSTGAGSGLFTDEELSGMMDEALWPAEQQRAKDKQHAQGEQAQAVAWLNDEENGSREVRVIRTFPAPRGYGS